jgi:phosphate:Na+ symporter
VTPPITLSGSALFNAAGGLGLFLLGMGLMTEALRSLAGNRLRQALLRFTRSPWSGAAAGAIGTALVQSSTATTVATVGFVSAGLLSFQSSLGIIFGANVGSTGLGWLVALFGIKFELAGVMLPLVLVVLPFTAPFAALIRRLVRPVEGRLIDDLADTPPVDLVAAISQARQALEPCLLELLQLLRDGLGNRGLGNGGPAPSSQRLVVLQADLDRLELYLNQIHLAPGPQPGKAVAAGEALLHLLHGLDHLQRLHERCEEDQDRLRTAATSAGLGSERQLLLATLERLPELVQQGRWPEASSVTSACAQSLQCRVAPYRQEVLAAVAQGELDVDAGTERLEAIRWLRRVSQHLERACHHLGVLEARR